jgi:diguanylate cyclase (GGDEF)-like protein
MDETTAGNVPTYATVSSVEHEAQVVGIRDFRTPTLEAVDRRRSQLWTVAFASLVCLSAAVGLLSTQGAHRLGFANQAGFRIGTVVLVVGLAFYVIEKERHLRQLAKLLIDERVLGAAMSNRLKELAVLYEAGKAMNSVLVVDEVLQLILSSAFELLEASSGFIVLLDESGELREACRAGDTDVTIELGDGIARRVVTEREPLLAQGRVLEKGSLRTQSTVCVPLMHRGEILGALSLSGSSDHSYSEHDLRAASLFAEHAAIAVANARLYEASQNLSAQLSHQVVHDSLTGAANRLLISERLTHALARVRRVAATVAVLFIDIDDFKQVNDELGHGIGDLVLAGIADRVTACIRPSDTVGRIGGDEFVVVCEDIDGDQSDAEKIALRVLNELLRPFSTPLGSRRISASIGVACCDSRHLMSAEDLIRAADAAMYRAKLDGKGRISSAPLAPEATWARST